MWRIEVECGKTQLKNFKKQLCQKTIDLKFVMIDLKNPIKKFQKIIDIKFVII